MSTAVNAKQTPLTCSGHTRPVVDLAFSPITSDGYFLVSACKDGKPMLRAGQTGDWIGTFEGHKGAVWSARLNSSATNAVTGSADFTAKLWDAISGSLVHTFDHQHIVRTVDFSKDGTKIITGGMEKKIRIFSLANPKATPEIYEFKSPIKIAMLCQNDQTILSVGEDSAIRISDVRSKSEVKSIPLDVSATSLEISADGNTLTAAHGNTVTFWDLASFEKIKSIKSATPLYSASLHPKNNLVVAGGNDFYLHVYDYATEQETELYKGHHGPVHCVRFSPDGELFASGSEDGTVRLWQTEVGKEYGLWKFSTE